MMRTIYIVILAFSSFVPAASFAQLDPHALIGKWQGVDEKKDSGSIEFYDQEKLRFSMKQGTLPMMTYKIDPTKNPMWMDMMLERPGGQHMVLKCLIKLIDDHTFKLQMFPDGKRPDDFTKEDQQGTSIVMKRVGG